MRRTLVTVVAAGTLLTAAGCGEPAPEPAASPTAPAGTAAPSPAAPTPGNSTDIAVTVRDGKVSTASGRVKVRRDATVRITVTSDAADELHVHGYDRTLALKPGTPGTLQLVADTPGVFEVELHHSGARVLELQVS
ncbi:hypothetical protein [Spirillospora sp. NPDC029432]|uniref:hypothetical protein n=1 Tax=Spirillospora sp. NPDC029432 TaxID=3154599 RepID=UPI003454DE9B